MATPYEGAETVSSTMGLRLSRSEKRCLSGGNRFAFEGCHIARSRLLLRGHDSLERLCENMFGGGKI